MKLLPKLLVFFLILTSLTSQAQKTTTVLDHKLNFVKLNLAGLLMKNFMVEYERVIKKKMSLSLSVRYMPYSSLPVRKLVQDLLENDDPNSYKIIDDIKMSNICFTPSVRFYLGSGYGHGMYIAPFYRFVHFSSKKLISMRYQDSEDATLSHQVDFSGSLTGNSFGFTVGSQWYLGQKICMDFFFFGPHFGMSTGSLVGVADEIPSPSEEADIKEKFDGLDIPTVHKEVTFNANKTNVNFKGGWGGIRFGLSVGYRF